MKYPRMPSGEEDRDLEKNKLVSNLVRSKLQENGDLERLRCYVQRRLVSTGWRDDMIKELGVAVKEIGIHNLTVEKLYERVAARGRIIDKKFEGEALRKIGHSCDKVLNEGDNMDFEQKPNVYNNDSIPRIRFNNRHKK